MVATFLSFEEIEAWQNAHQLTRAIYQVTGQRTFARDFGLRDQMRRAAVSVMSNVAEGFERGGAAEFARFLRIAKGSLGELTAQLYVALDERYIDQETFVRLRTLASDTSRLLGGLIRYLRKAGNGSPLFTQPAQPVTRNSQPPLSIQAPLVPVTLAFLAGILLGTSAWLPPVGFIVVGTMSAGVALWRSGRNVASSELRVPGELVDPLNAQPVTRNPQLVTRNAQLATRHSQLIALLLLWLCLGALRMTIWERHPDTQLKEVLLDDPQPVQLHGLVVDDPVELFEPGEADSKISDKQQATSDRGGRHVVGSGLRVSGELVETRNSQLGTRDARQICVVALRHQKIARSWQPISGRIRATVHSPRQLLRYGDEVLVEGMWSRVPAPGNPGQYDWQAALARKRIHGLLRVRPFDGLVVLRSGRHRGARGVADRQCGRHSAAALVVAAAPNARAFGRHGKGNPVLAAVFRLRQRWVQLIQEHFEPRDAGLLLALLLGERAEIDDDLKEAFQTTWTMHLLERQCTKLHRDSPASRVTSKTATG